jgi:hypothetical protein
VVPQGIVFGGRGDSIIYKVTILSFPWKKILAALKRHCGDTCMEKNVNVLIKHVL